MTSLDPDAHAKIFATAATVPHASVLKVIPGMMLTILASVSNKQCSCWMLSGKPVKRSLD